MMTTLRRWIRTPGFTLAVIVLVAVTVAVNATAFSAIHALRWKALPYPVSDQLVEPQADLRGFGFAVGLTESLRAQLAADASTFAAVMGFKDNPRPLPQSDGAGRGWRVTRVGVEFEQVLGVAPVLGRGWLEEDMHEGADRVLLLSDAAWRGRFDSDPDVIGRTLELDGTRYSIIGVMPRGFAFPGAGVDAWRPLALSAEERAATNVGELDVIARLAPGISLAQAQARLGAVFEHDPAMLGLRENAGLSPKVRAWRERSGGEQIKALGLLQLGAFVLFLVAVSNLVMLNLDRMLGRTRELAVRRALGASGGAILRGAMSDLLPPVLAGTALGLVLAPLGLHVLRLRGLLPEDLVQGADFGLAGALAGVCVAAAAFVAIALATLPAARVGLSSRAGVAGFGKLRPAMLVAQVMLTTALLGSTGLLLRSAVNLLHAERGFDAQGVLLTMIDPLGVTIQRGSYDPARDYERLKAQVMQIRDSVAALPGVQKVAVASAVPFSGWESVSGVADGEARVVTARDRFVGPDYHAAMGIAIIAGRAFSASDEGPDAPVIVDELYALRHLSGIDPLTAEVRVPIDGDGNYRPARIIGVARTVKHESLDEAEILPTVYQPGSAPLPVFWLVTRADAATAALAQTVRERVLAVVPLAQVGVNRALVQSVDDSLAPRRALLQAVGGFTLATLGLAALGLAAVLGVLVHRRASELGMRLAVGATPARVRNLVLRQGGVLAVIGAVLGLAVGLMLARALSDRFFGVAYTDVSTWLAAVLLILTVALTACWVPARRAAKVSPMVALRSE